MGQEIEAVKRTGVSEGAGVEGQQKWQKLIVQIYADAGVAVVVHTVSEMATCVTGSGCLKMDGTH